jgi:inner membrane transporter RhtA
MSRHANGFQTPGARHRFRLRAETAARRIGRASGRTKADPDSMPPHLLARLVARLPAPALLVGALVLVQLGSAWAKVLLALGSPLGMTSLRLVASAALLLALVRPKPHRFHRGQMADIALLGVAFAAFNLSYYAALARLPLGLVATIGLIGPLSISFVTASRGLDYVWPVLGLAGVLMLTPWRQATGADWPGIAAGLAYAGCWAGYVLASSRAGRSTPGLEGYALATAGAALLVLPMGLAEAKPFLVALGSVAAIIGLAAFSSLALCLEFLALRRMAPRVFGVLLSLEPAIASFAGMAFLHEFLTPTGWVAVGAVSLASVGATLTAHPPPDPDASDTRA